MTKHEHNSGNETEGQEHLLELDLGLDCEADRLKADEAYREFAELQTRVSEIEAEMQFARAGGEKISIHEREVMIEINRILQETREKAVYWEIRARAGEASVEQPAF